MKSIANFIGVAVVIVPLLAACKDVKSVEYYAAHKDEALQRLAECRGMDVKVQISDPVCVNPTKGYALYRYTERRAVVEAERKAIQEWKKGSTK